jgi:hypothetical protein
MKELAKEKLKAIHAFSSKFLEFFSVLLVSLKNDIGLLWVCVLFLCGTSIYIVHTAYVFLILEFLFNKTSLPGETLGTLFNLLSF